MQVALFPSARVAGFVGFAQGAGAEFVFGSFSHDYKRFLYVFSLRRLISYTLTVSLSGNASNFMRYEPTRRRNAGAMFLRCSISPSNGFCSISARTVSIRTLSLFGNFLSFLRALFATRMIHIMQKFRERDIFTACKFCAPPLDGSNFFRRRQSAWNIAYAIIQCSEFAHPVNLFIERFAYAFFHDTLDLVFLCNGHTFFNIPYQPSTSVYLGSVC